MTARSTTATLPTPVLPAPAAAAVAAVKAYGTGDAEVRALDGVTVAFDRGRFTAIMGPSGSGKSTLLHCLAGLDTLTSGDVRLGDRSLTGLKDKDLTLLRRDRMGFVFQAFNLLPTLTAEENILLPLQLAGAPVDREWFDTVVSAVGLTERLGHTPAQLSGGQQQGGATPRHSCPAASSSGSPPPARWSPARRSSSPTSRPVRWTPAAARTCWRSCAERSTSSARRSSWSPTTRSPPRTPTGWSSSPTAASATS